MSTIGERIRNARESHGLYQSDLAKSVGVKSSAVISNWEKDLNKPDADKIVRLCEALNISVSYLLDYSGGDDFSFQPHEIEYIKKYRGLDDHGKEVIDYLLDKEYERAASEKQGIDRLIELTYGEDRVILSEAEARAAAEDPSYAVALKYVKELREEELQKLADEVKKLEENDSMELKKVAPDRS